MGKVCNSLAGKAALAASATLLAVALPSSVFAIGQLDGADARGANSRFIFTPASADPAIAELIAENGGAQGRMMRFTPAGAANSRAERSVTVAVRIDQEMARTLTVSGIGTTPRESASAPGGLRVAPVRYNLGIARGYGSFAQSPSQFASRVAAEPMGTRATRLSSTLSDANIPDLSTFGSRTGSREEQGRFAARVDIDSVTPVAASGARPSVRDQILDVGGSYRLTNNLDITAGVRYEQDREIVPLPEIDQQDSQAVYIGTQFRF